MPFALLLAWILSGKVPAIIAAADGPPVWIAAGEAIDGDGHLRADLLGQHAASLKENARLNGDGECRAFTGSVPGHFAPNGSREELETHAQAIVSGEAVSMAEGFLHGAPGTLIALIGSEPVQAPMTSRVA